MDCVQRNDSFDNHHDFQHYVLLYNDTSSRDGYIIDFINQGLTSKEFCIYATVGLRDKDSSSVIKRIIDYEKNISESNLMVVDLAPFYIGALTEDLRLFEEMKKEVSERIKNRENKNIRFVGDGTGFLFDNKHFSQCKLVESWWQHQRPLKGVCLCPYQKSNLEKYPFNIHKDNVIGKQHDNVIDAEEYILSKDGISNKRDVNSSLEISNEEEETRRFN